MYIEVALKEELNSIESIKDNIYPITAFEGVKYPYLTYQVENDGPTQFLGGGYSNSRELDISYDLYCESYQQLKEEEMKTADLLRDLWNCYIGSSNSFFISSIKVRGPRELYEHEVDCFRANFEVNLNYKKIEGGM